MPMARRTTPRRASRPTTPEATTPTNHTGGLYASDLFLQATTFRSSSNRRPSRTAGLIDITFDEAAANPPFTIGNSFNNVAGSG